MTDSMASDGLRWVLGTSDRRGVGCSSSCEPYGPPDPVCDNCSCTGDAHSPRSCGLCRVKGARPPHVPPPTHAPHYIGAAQRPVGPRRRGAARGLVRHRFWQISGTSGCLELRASCAARCGEASGVPAGLVEQLLHPVRCGLAGLLSQLLLRLTWLSSPAVRPGYGGAARADRIDQASQAWSASSLVTHLDLHHIGVWARPVRPPTSGERLAHHRTELQL